MSENIGENIAIKQFAQEAGYTEQYLRKLFLKYLNVTPKQYYLKLKLDASMMMLKRSGTNVKRVAFELGFNDSFHFSRAFKNSLVFAHQKQTKSDGQRFCGVLSS